MASFFGPSSPTLGGLPFQGQSTDPITQAILSRFPQLGGPRSGGQSLSSLGYGYPGPDLGQGSNSGLSGLGLFEGAKPVTSESLTGGLAFGTLGKSSSQQPLGTPPSGENTAGIGGYPAFPNAQLADVGAQAGSPMTINGPATGGVDQGGGIDLGAIINAGGGLFGGGPNLGTQTDLSSSNPQAMQQQRASERDLSAPLDTSFFTSPSFNSATPTVNPNTFQAMQNVHPGDFDIPFPSMTGMSPGSVDIAGNIVGFPQTAPGIVPVNLSGQIDPAYLQQLGIFQPGAGSGGGGPIAPSFMSGNLLGGGLSTLGGLANLYSGAQSGSVPALLSGVGSTLSGIGQLFPQSGIGGGALGTVGGAAAAPFAALGLVQAIDDGDPMAIASNLASLYGTTVPVINAIFGSSLPTLTSIAGSVLSSLGSSIGGSFGSALGSLGASIGGGVGAGAGAGAGVAAGEAVASAAAGAGAALPLGMLVGPYVVAKLMQAYQALGPDKANARELGIRVNNIYGQLPGEASQIQSIPGIIQGLNQSTTPEQAAAMLKQLNDIETGFNAGGWENYWKSGQTSVNSENPETDLSVKLPGVQSALDQMQPFLMQSNVARLRATDILGNAGWTPEQIAAQTGNYFDPVGTALLLNGITPTIAGSQSPSDPLGLYTNANFLPTFRSAILPPFMQGELANAQVWNPESSSGYFNDRPMTGADDMAGLRAMGLPTQRADGTPLMLSDVRNAVSGGGSFQNLTEASPAGYGEMVKQLEAQVNAIHPGQYESQLPALLQQYGGVNPYYTQYGFGQGLPVDPRMTPEVQQYQQALNQYNQGVNAFQQNAQSVLGPQSLPSVMTSVVPAGVPTGGLPLTPTTITGGGLSPEQLAWLRSIGWQV